MRKRQLGIVVGAVISVVIAYQQGIAGDKYKKNNKQVNREYNNALRLMWTKVYKDKGVTLYCDKPFSTKSRKERAKADVNAEHVFPMSWVAKDLNCGTRKQCQAKSAKFREIESDLHNIYPAGRIENKARSNYRFGDVAGGKREFGRCDFEVNEKNRIAEPAVEKRGEVARSMLYLADQYGLSLHKKTEKLMKQWNKEDPPSAEEKRREKIIHREQGKENKFITEYPYKG